MRSKKARSKKSKDYSFTRDDTKAIKGFAIILMLAHHLWFFPSRIAAGGGELNYLFSLSGQSIPMMVGGFCKICVSLFFLLGGYGIYLQSKKRGFTILNCIKKLFIAYWKVFIVFVPIALIFFANQSQYCADGDIWSRYSGVGVNEILKNFFGISASLYGEWGFLFGYVVAIITFPLWKHVFSKLSIYKSVLLVIIVGLVLSYVMPALNTIGVFGDLDKNSLYRNFLSHIGGYYVCFPIGILFAQYDWFNKIRKLLHKNFRVNLLTSLFALMALIFIRQRSELGTLDIIYAPAVAICVVEIIRRLPTVGRFLALVGRHSTTMWLTHTFWCYYFGIFAKLVTWPRWAVPSFLLLFAITFIVAFCFDHIWAYLSKLYAKSMQLFHAK